MSSTETATPFARILVATCLAPMVIVIPVFVAGVFLWSNLTTGPFANAEQLKSIAPGEFAWSFVAPVYLLLSGGLLVVASILRALKKLTRRAMLAASACIAFGLGLWLGPGWGLSFEPLESVVGVVTQSLIAFLILGAVSLVWCRLAIGRAKSAEGQG